MEVKHNSLEEALFHGEREAKVKAAIHITTLTPLQKNKLVDMGIISPLISMLESRDFESMEAALFGLLSLSMRSLRNKIRIVELDALPSLAWIIKKECGLVVEIAIAILLSISTCNANKSSVAKSGVISLLLKYLHFQANDDELCNMQVKFDAIDTLRNLATNNQAVLLMISEGCVFSLLQWIQNSDKVSKMVEKATGLLETIASSSEVGIGQIGSVEGGVLALVETVEEGSNQSREHAVGVLYLMCKSSREKYREMILREGAIPGLLQLRVEGTWRGKDSAISLLLLLREPASDYDHSRRQLKNVIVEQIMREIESEEVKVGDTTVRLVEKMRNMMNVAA